MSRQHDMIKHLDNYGVITVKADGTTVSITEIDDKEGYQYISDSHEKFADSKEAIDWIVKRVNGTEHIREWG